jgi:6-pyruvoyltetrahydropterin/6-carboxytetrahydropterin synthase
MHTDGPVYISRKVSFSAAHRMFNPGLSEEENLELYGKCANPGAHGHNYVLEVTVAGKTDSKTGMVTNLDGLKTLLDKTVLSRLDHKLLNTDVEALRERVPSLENLTRAIWEMLEPEIKDAELYEVKVWETDNNCAWYRGGK